MLYLCVIPSVISWRQLAYNSRTVKLGRWLLLYWTTDVKMRQYKQLNIALSSEFFVELSITNLREW